MYGTDKGRYDGEYFAAIDARNKEFDALCVGVEERLDAGRCLPNIGRLIAAGHVLVEVHARFVVRQDGRVALYADATYRVAPDSPIFKRVFGHALEIIQQYRAQDTDLDRVRVLQAQVEKFCAPLGARAQDIVTMASMATTSNAAASGSLLIAIRERA